MEAKHTLCIGMCIYDNKYGVPYLFSNLKQIHDSCIFSTLRFVFIYEDNDPNLSNMNDQISKFSETVHTSVVDMIKNRYPWEPVRQRNIGHARNSFLDYLREIHSDAEQCIFSHFAFMDFNDYACIGPLNTMVLQDVMTLSHQWDCVSFLREAAYYDLWALSFDPYIHSFFHFKRAWYDVVDRMRKMFDKIVFRAISRGDKFLPVYSAFNGFAIYRSSVYLSDKEPRIKYSDEIRTDFYPKRVLENQIYFTDSETDGRTNDDCEHRYFHLASLQPPHNARIYIYLKSLFKKMPKNVTLPYIPRADV